MRLAVRARSTGLSASDVDRALTEDRSVVVAWLNRGTLHLVPATDYWWLRDLVTARMATGNRRRLAQEGVTPTQAERGVDVIVTALSSEGPLTRDQLKDRLDDAGVPTAGQALVHIILAASISHPIARGPVVDGRHAFVDATSWLDQPPPMDRNEALVLLAGRYLRGHSPADDRDLATWSGLPLADVRAGLAQVTDHTSQTTKLPAPKLLGPFDPVLHGWASRQWIVGDDENGVVTNNGIFRATALVEGKVVATWKMAGDELTVEPRQPLEDETLAALHADGEDVRRYLAS